jgi:hypothetical protein
MYETWYLTVSEERELRVFGNKMMKGILKLRQTNKQANEWVKKKVKQSRYTPWRRMGGEEV